MVASASEGSSGYERLVPSRRHEAVSTGSQDEHTRLMATIPRTPNAHHLDEQHRENLKRSASKLKGHERRAFQASVTLKYCRGSPAQAEKVFGWGRQAVALGLNELRTNLVCYSARAAFSGNKLWEEKHPEAADALWAIARSYAQLDPTVSARRAKYRRITAVEAIEALREQGFAVATLPSITTMTAVLNRKGLRQVRVGTETLARSTEAQYTPRAPWHSDYASPAQAPAALP